jgi:transcriptional accessory protein Tex/SPT6
MVVVEKEEGYKRKKEVPNSATILTNANLIAQVPLHRALAMFRGCNAGVLQLALNTDPQFEVKRSVLTVV